MEEVIGKRKPYMKIVELVFGLFAMLSVLSFFTLLVMSADPTLANSIVKIIRALRGEDDE